MGPVHRPLGMGMDDLASSGPIQPIPLFPTRRFAQQRPWTRPTMDRIIALARTWRLYRRFSTPPELGGYSATLAKPWGGHDDGLGY